MAATLLARIEDYVGTQTDTAAIDEWILAACRWLITFIPEEEAAQHATSTTITNGSTSISNKRLLDVIRNGYRAIKAAPWMVGALADSGSIWSASSRSPRYIITDGGKITIYPTTGSPTITVLSLDTPSPTNASTSISTFPTSLEHAVVLYAAIQARLKQLETTQVIVGALAWVSPVVPTVPADASYSYTDAVVGVINSTTIDALGTAPVYTKPILVMPSSPSALDISSITPPTVPTAPSYSIIDAQAGTIASTAIDTLPTAPTFNKVSLVLPTTPAELDLDSITPPAVPVPPLYSYTDAVVGTINSTLLSLPAAPVYTAPGLPLSFSNAVTAITTNEDIELGQAELQVLQTQLAQYKVDIENSIAKFNEAKTVYEAGVQKNLNQAQLDQQRLVEAARLTTDVNLKNEAEAAATAAQLYSSVMAKYQGDLKRYSDQVQLAITVYQANLSLFQFGGALQLQWLAAVINNEWHDFERLNTVYQATILRAVEQAKLDQVRLLEAARLTTDVNLKNRAEGAALAVQLYSAVLQKFQGDLKSYSDQVQSTVQAYQVNLSRLQSERATLLQAYSADVENEWKNFEKLNVVYQATTLRAMEQAKLDQTRLLQAAQMTTEVNLRNEQQEAATKIALAAVLLEKYAHQVQRYQAEVGAESQRIQVLLARSAEHAKELEVSLKEMRVELQTLLAPYIPKEKSNG